MEIGRTRFAKDIVCEYVKPARLSVRTIVFCSGLPVVPEKKSFLKFLSTQGFWVFFPRYRGTWESDGAFLARSPEEDVQDVVRGLQRKFYDLWTNKAHTAPTDNLYVVGSSFGGSAAILSSGYQAVKKAVAISPVVNWRLHSKEEPLPKFKRYLRKGFGNGYRFTEKHWQNLANARFYNPVSELARIEGKKLLIVHAKDDSVVSYAPVKAFATKTNSFFIKRKKGGHFGSSVLVKNKVLWRQIKQFLIDDR